ncbi:metallophosphoesterase [Fusibacter paucivorans]|uniref:Metallophosphoesterase n=1 Tax=Fusibacter paucivorans TaxID=76009 RepID=A0ABS5PKX0_9FIRM|nr:metallophosphoesterase [Fusibacter paucivorans]MBS7525693.1 metallophosphoesterase [Fusibacter paucivorans]
MIRLLHLSDLHINAGFANKSAYIREQLKLYLNKSFECAVTYAVTHKIDGVMIVGDFFDRPQVDYALERFVKQQLTKLLDHDIHIFYVNGNHDPADAMTLLNAFADHRYFHAFDSDTFKRQTVTFESGETGEFIASGHAYRGEQRDLVKHYPVKSNACYWVGMAHASVVNAQSTGEKTAYMGTTLPQIESLGYDYFALGHIHIRQQLSERVAYAGNLQGLNYKEIGGKGGLLVTLSERGTSVESVDFNEIQWEAIDFEVTEEVGTLYELETALTDTIAEHISDLGYPPERLIVRVHLYGRSKCYHSLRDAEALADLETAISQRLKLLNVDLKDIGLANDYDLKALAREQTVLAMALEIMDAPERHPELLTRLYRLPMFKTTTTVQSRETLLREYMDSVRDELVDRMLKVPNED